jgi:hypothetical protein
MPTIVENYSPMKLVQFLEDNSEMLETVFSKEHLADLTTFSKFMLRFMPEPDPKAAQKLGYAAAGTFKKTRNFSLSHASIISRVYAAESGRTSFRYIGAEAVLGVLLNSNSEVLGSLFLDPKLSGKVVDFLADPTMSIRDTGGNIVSWVHELAGLSQALGDIIVEVGIAATELFSDDEYYFISELQKDIGYGKLRPSLSDRRKGTRLDKTQIKEEDSEYTKLEIQNEDLKSIEDVDK